MQARRAVALLASLRTVPAAAGRVSTLCVAPRRSFPGVVRAPLSRGFSDAAGGAAEGEGGAVKAGPTDEEYVDINEALVGHVIGKQGAQIQRIQKDSGARVSIDKGANPKVLLKGTDAARAKAKEMIAQVVATAVANMPLRVSMSVTREQGGVLIGKGGENIRQLEVDTKCRINLQKAEEGMEDEPRKLIITGPEQFVTAAKLVIQDILDRHTSDKASYEEGGGRERLGGGMGGGRAAAKGEREEFMIPSSVVGVVVGKGGVNIRKIMEDSGATIFLDQTDRDKRGPETKIMVQGSLEARAKARLMIEEIKASSEAGQWWGEGEAGDGMAAGGARSAPDGGAGRGKRFEKRGGGGGFGRGRADAEDDDDDMSVTGGGGGWGRVMQTKLAPMVPDLIALVDVSALIVELAADNVIVDQATKELADDFAEILSLNGLMSYYDKKVFIKRFMRFSMKPVYEYPLREQEDMM